MPTVTPAKKRQVRRKPPKKQTKKSNGSSASEEKSSLPSLKPPPTPAVPEPNIPERFRGAVDVDEPENDDAPTAGTSPAVDGAWNTGESPTKEKVEFDVWMAHHRQWVEHRPDDFMFGVVRKYPKQDDDGNPIGGTILRLKKGFSEAWLRKALPEGGRYTIQLLGPTKNPSDKFIGLKVTYASYHNLEIPMVGIPRDPELGLPPFEDEEYEDDEDELEDEEELTNGKGSALSPTGNPFVDRIVTRHLDEAEEAKRELEQMRRRPPVVQAPPPFMPPRRRGRDDDDEDSPFSKVMLKLVDRMGNAPVTDDSARKEVAKLHELINKLNEAHTTEKINTLAAHREDMEKRLREQRESFDRALRDANDSAQKTIDRLSEQSRNELQSQRDNSTERVTTLREQLADAKQELRDMRSELRDETRRLQTELDTTRVDLAAARSELASAQSKYEALQVTKGSELETRIAQVKMEAMETARKEELQRIAQEKSERVDPIDQMTKSVEMAKTLATSLGAKFGLGDSGDATPAAPQGRLDKAIDAAIKIGGSPEVRKLAGTVTKSMSEGLATVLQSRDAAKAQAKQTSAPSTAAITSAWQSGQRPAPAQRRTAQATAQANPPPEQVDHIPTDQGDQVTGTDVADALNVVADAIPDVATIQAKADPMLDDIENHSMLDTPVEEAAEEMIERLMDILNVTRAEVCEGLVDASAEKTLEELEYPVSRLSPGALAYMNELIKYGASQHAAN